MSSLQVITRKEDLDPRRLGDQVVIVLDILFATSTMVHALAEGVAGIWPALNGEDASAVADGLGECIRSGEHLTEGLPGFAAAWPLMLSRESLRGRKLVYCTTNGTVALRTATAAAVSYIGALLNAAAVVEHVRREHPGAPVLIACSGSAGNFNLEDFYGAGRFVELFESQGEYQLNDAARAAKLLRQAYPALTVLKDSRVGRIMQTKGLSDEVEYCAQLDILNVVGRLEGGVLRRVTPKS
jgi:2-phosphosulfolactate phosphatase